jgi:hypothetical protein
MKKNLLSDSFKHPTKLLLLAIFTVLGAQSLLAQVQNNSSLYVGQNASLFTNGTFSFGSGSTTETNRGSGTNHGKIIFGATASVSGAATGASLFVDGFANTRSSAYFVLPTGNGTTYAPVGVTNTSVTNGVDAAYTHATPVNNNNIDASITALLGTGYWEMKGDAAKITLIWSSDISAVSNSLADVTVAGYNASTNNWEAIDCDAPTGSLTAGTITTSAAVALGNYTAFTLGEKGVSCAPVFAGTGNTITFNGTSWSATPTDNDFVTITGTGNPGSFVCNTLDTGTFDITLTGDQSIEVVNDVTGSGKIIMSSETSFVQRKTNGTPPAIELTKTTRAIKRYDYVYWGSPVSDNAFSQLSNALVPTYATGAFDLMYKYVSGVTGTSGAWQPLTTIEEAKGFIMRVKGQAPFTDATTTAAIDLKFTGAANNGTKTVSLGYASGLTARNNNLLANPYPSAIDADKFLTQNSHVVDGVIYLWRASTTNTTGTSQYAIGDYIAYTKAGSTAYGGMPNASTVNFDGKIASGQGFKVKALSAGTVEFNNCMRVAAAGSNSQFFRASNAYAGINDSTRDRFKVNLQTSAGIANQILVAYLPETSLAYDHMYDAELLSVSPTRMYSILDNDTKKLAINARPAFTNTDQVNVGYAKADTTPTQMSITIEQKEGTFANNQTPIYLHDTQLSIYHDFANGAYTFTTTAQEENNRFKIVYQTSALGNEDFDNSNAFASLNNYTLQVHAKIAIEQVLVFDITGRLILNLNPTDVATTLNAPFDQAEGIYVVKILLTNGQTVTSKLINKF